MTEKRILLVDGGHVDPSLRRMLEDLGRDDIVITADAPREVIAIRSHEELARSQVRMRPGMSAMQATTLMVSGVTEDEVKVARGIKPGARSKQAHKTRSKDARAKQRGIKQARKRNKGK